MTEQNNNNDDITLSSVKNSFIDLLLALYTILQSIFSFFFRNKVIILVCVVIFGGIGFLFAMRVKQVYSLKMIVSHSDLTKRTYAEAIDQLNRLAQSRSYKQLGHELNLDEASAENIRTLKTYNMNGDLLLDDTSSTRYLPFMIDAEVFNNSVTDSLQEGLLRYFNDNKYFKGRKEIQKRIYEEKLVFISSELEKLDSLKRQYNQFLESSGKSAVFYNNAFNPAEIYQRSNEYQQQKETVTSWLNNEYQTIKVIEGFKPGLRPVDGFKERIILYFILGGILIGCFLGAFIELQKLSKQKSA
jgi:N-methylhydantoinase A/oxoprolinase/acetone carboxylase beta subunit